MLVAAAVVVVVRVGPGQVVADKPVPVGRPPAVVGKPVAGTSAAAVPVGRPPVVVPVAGASVAVVPVAVLDKVHYQKLAPEKFLPPGVPRLQVFVQVPIRNQCLFYHLSYTERSSHSPGHTFRYKLQSDLKLGSS